MKELIWIDGVISNLADAKISVEDRGYQFADGVYEVARVYEGVPFTLKEHLERLDRSAKEIRMELPMSVAQLTGEILSVIEKSGMNEGMVYVQLTRGVAPRNHVFPKSPRPTLLFYVRELPPPPVPGETAGLKVITVEDDRWKRCWIKTIALLPNVLAKNYAIEKGCDEAVFVENGIVSECSVSNLLIVSKGKLITHPVGPKVLPGITRATLISLAKSMHIPFEERPLTVSDCETADEIMVTSTTREVGWVAQWNDKKIASRVGETTLALHRAYQAKFRSDVAKGKKQPVGV